MCRQLVNTVLRCSDSSLTLYYAVRTACNGELDLAFLMDSSGSIMHSDYTLQRNFVAQVVNALPVASDKVQIANVVFGTLAKVAFLFNTYTAKADIIDDIQHTDKGQAGTPAVTNEVFFLTFKKPKQAW